jgi:hypothetical protein
MIFIDPYEKKQISFTTHKELDEYAYSLLKIKSKDKKEIEKAHSKFLIENPEDYHLLKSYDRAFWMCYLKLNKQIQEAQNIINENEKNYNEFADDMKKEFDELKNTLKSWKEKIAKSQPLMSEKNCNCFFGDPNLTNTC